MAYTFICSFQLAYLRDRGASKERCYAGPFSQQKGGADEECKAEGCSDCEVTEYKILRAVRRVGTSYP